MDKYKPDTPVEERVWVNCPFCGEMDANVEVDQHTADDDKYFVWCGCGAEGPRRATPDQARKSWNTRYVDETETLLPFVDPDEDRDKFWYEGD